MPAQRGAGSVFLGLSFRDLEIMAPLDRLADLDWDEAQDNPLGTEAKAIIDEITAIDDHSGFLITAAGGVGVRAGGFGTGLFVASEAAGYVLIDEVRVLRVLPSNPLSFANNRSELFIRGAAITEIPLAYGHDFELNEAGRLALGGALKLMYGNTYEASTLVTEAEDLADDYKQYEESSSAFGVDLGALYRLPNDRLALGLVLKNLNGPEFDTYSGTTHTEALQARAGTLYEAVSNKLAFAVDLDLTRNETPLAGYDSRMLGGGVEFRPAEWFAARLGLMKNLASSEQADPGLVLTGGIAVGAKEFAFNLALAGTTGTDDFQGYPYRSDMRVALSFQSRW
ncbi:MAG: conjugal transfer protein TraF [Kiritimatiellae bacterium]|nr:conjugal transfer protein TraF [Kiritimatiellia bacterium]